MLAVNWDDAQRPAWLAVHDRAAQVNRVVAQLPIHERVRAGLDRGRVGEQPGRQEGDAEGGQDRRQEARAEAEGELVHGPRLAAGPRNRPRPLVLVPSGR